MSKKLTITWLAFIHLLFLITAIAAFRDKSPLLLVASEFLIPFLFAITLLIIKRLIRPVATMSRSLNMLKEGDFSSTLTRTGNRDVDSLITVYNSMISRLREERLSIREKNHFLDLLIESSPLGIVIVDFDERIIEINKAALRFLGINDINTSYTAISRLESPIARVLSSMSYDNSESVALPDGRKYVCRKLFFMDQGFRHPFFIIEELTEEIRMAEKEAYGKIIRMMAHEVNNTIGSVNSIMSSIAASPGSFTEADREEIITMLEVAVQRNYQMNRFMQGFSNVVKLPLPDKVKTGLNNPVQSVVDSFRIMLQAKKIKIIIDTITPAPEIFADRSQIEQVFFNILKNSYEASEESGTIRISTLLKPLRICFEDEGRGIEEKALGKIFTPFFSDKPGGQGIGLTLAREILTNHGFGFTFKNRKEGGTVFIIYFEN